MENKVQVKTTKYNSIDICKIFMAVCVVAIHTQPLKNYSGNICLIYNAVVRLAVPFFFISAGFLLANKLTLANTNYEKIDTIRNYLTKIIKLYLLWTAIYLPMAIYHFISSGTGYIKATLIYIRGFLLIGEQYNSWPLWYLLSTIYALLFMLLLLRYTRIKMKGMVYIGILFYLFSIGVTYLTEYEQELPTIAGFIQKIFRYSIGSGRIFTGFFFLPVGMLLAERKNSKWIGGVVMLFSFCGYLLVNNSINSIFTAFCAIGLFMFVKELHLSDAPIYAFVRKISSVIYFIHMYVWTAYYMLVYKEKTFGMDSFIFTTMVSCLIGIAFFALRNKFKRIKC